MAGNGYSINLAEFLLSANLDFFHISPFHHIMMSYGCMHLHNNIGIGIGNSMK